MARIHQPFSKTFFVFHINICKLKCNKSSDWLNLRFSQSEVVLHSNVSNVRKNLENKTKNVLRNGCCIRIQLISIDSTARINVHINIERSLGRRTSSMIWRTPLLAGISAIVIVARFTLITPETNMNSLPDDKILDWFKLKQTADDILKCI